MALQRRQPEDRRGHQIRDHQPAGFSPLVALALLPQLHRSDGGTPRRTCST